MTDTDFDYPRASTVAFGTAVEDLADRVDDLEAKTGELADAVDVPDDEDPDPAAVKELQETRQDLSQARQQHDALQWAVDQWGEDAEVRLQALTAGSRARVEDTLREGRVGGAGVANQENWILAACLTDAPFLGDGDDLQDRVAVIAELPPALADWLRAELDALNDLSAGN